MKEPQIELGALCYLAYKAIHPTPSTPTALQLREGNKALGWLRLAQDLIDG